MVNLNERNHDLLSNLGLDQLFTISAAAAPAVASTQALASGPVDKATQTETMIQAHEELVEANPENAAKFKDVLEYLKQDLHLAR